MPSRTNATQTANELCPFCGKAISSDESSRDHVFGQAFGGRIKVACCRPCNSTVGHDIEGRLHAPDSFLALARAAAGLPGKPLSGHYRDDGTRVDVHWAEGGAVPRDPEVRVSEGNGRLTIQVAGTEEQVRTVWRGLTKKYGSAVPPVEEALAQATRTSGPSPWVEIDLTNELPLLHRFAAKVALSGGAAIWGDPFIETPLAGALRGVLATTDAGYRADALKCDFKYLSTVVSLAQEVAPIDLPQIALPKPGQGVVPTSQVVFAPIPGGGEATTGVFVSILNFSTPPYGMLLPEAMPQQLTLPIVLREELAGQAVSWNLDEIYFGAIARLANDS